MGCAILSNTAPSELCGIALRLYFEKEDSKLSTLLSVSIALMVGLLMTRAFKPLKLPAVTAYLIAGVLIGPYCLGALGIDGVGFKDFHAVEALSLISDVALGFIAFSIGNEFRLEELKKTGKQALVIGVFQALAATLLVDAALFAAHLIMPDKITLPQVLTLGAIATATAPAATLMVVRQYKAKGPVTDILLPIVALDDAVGLVLFAISFGVAKALISGYVSVISVIVEPILEVVLSIALGAAMGYLFSFCERFFHSRSKRLAMSVTFVLLTVALSMFKFNIGGVHVAFSSLLVCMMLGTVFCNVCDFSEELMDRVDRWTAPLFILFFVISGAELELAVFKDYTVVLIGLVYILFRCLGKYFGASLSSRAVKCDSNIVKYLGITLFPQAGVALGMAIKAEALGECGMVVANITLFSVLVYELVGPYLTKVSLMKAGEIQPEGKVSTRDMALEHKKIHGKMHDPTHR